MPGNSAVRNRSRRVTVNTPRGPVEVLRQEMRGIKGNLGWRRFWLARRRGQQDWHEATTAREAIRKAVLLRPRKPPAWLAEAASTAERELAAPSARTDEPTVDDSRPPLT